MKGDQWTDDAACANTDPDLWFPELGGSGFPAKRICATCDVQQICLDEAMRRGERWGIWGGLSTVEMAALRRKQA